MTRRRTDLRPGMEVSDEPYTVVLLREVTPRGNWWVRWKTRQGDESQIEFQLSRAHINSERARKRAEIK